MLTRENAYQLSPIDGGQSRSDLVAEGLRDAILSGDLSPGTPLVERKVAADMQVSKSPVREAIINLARTGLVQINRNRSAFVADLSLSTISDVYQARLLLEPWAVAESVRRGIPQSMLDEAQQKLDISTQPETSPVKVTRAKLNREFHRLLYAHCRNDFVIAAIDQSQDLLALGATKFLWSSGDSWIAEAQEHQRILDQVRRQEPDVVQELVTQHIIQSIQRMQNLKQKLSLKGTRYAVD